MYGGFSEEARNRYASLARLFQLQNWPAAEAARQARKIGLTHLLIHKHYPHADRIPLVPIHENDDYIVYRF